MRFSLIIASFAVTLLAAPAPAPQGEALKEFRNSLNFKERKVEVEGNGENQIQEADLKAPNLRDYDRREAEAGMRDNYRREAEAKPTFHPANNHDAKVEPIISHKDQRDVEAKAGGVRDNSRREAEAYRRDTDTRGFSSATLL